MYDCGVFVCEFGSRVAEIARKGMPPSNIQAAVNIRVDCNAARATLWKWIERSYIDAMLA
jgi:hypothetical protein